MKTERNIFIAFILNLAFSIFEIVGGFFTGSVAILSDALHDIGDATSIGISYFLEKKSKKKEDEKYTYGYVRYSIIGGVITTLILIIGSFGVICNVIKRITNPVEINYNGMIIFAIIGVIVNSLAAYFTGKGNSINQKAVNLHMLEDVLGWIVVLIGAVVMRFTGLAIIDSILSICVAIFIMVSAIINLKKVVEIILLKVPKEITIKEIKQQLLEVDGVIDVHHIHIWTIDGEHNYATLHIVAKQCNHEIKEKIKSVLAEHKITHTTLEFEENNEDCPDRFCEVETPSHGHHHKH